MLVPVGMSTSRILRTLSSHKAMKEFSVPLSGGVGFVMALVKTAWSEGEISELLLRNRILTCSSLQMSFGSDNRKCAKTSGLTGTFSSSKRASSKRKRSSVIEGTFSDILVQRVRMS